MAKRSDGRFIHLSGGDSASRDVTRVPAKNVQIVSERFRRTREAVFRTIPIKRHAAKSKGEDVSVSSRDGQTEMLH